MILLYGAGGVPGRGEIPKNPRGANIVVIGALAKTTDVFDYDYLRSAIDQFFLKKGKVNPKNVVCFDKGAEYMVQN